VHMGVCNHVVFDVSCEFRADSDVCVMSQDFSSGAEVFPRLRSDRLHLTKVILAQEAFSQVRYHGELQNSKDNIHAQLVC